jgi:hypothetical protein
MAKMLGSKMMSSGREADLVDQGAIGPLADRDLALPRVGLPLLVERHHHHRRAVAQALRGLVEELLVALLQADRIDDGLALHALQPGLDHLPFGAVDHDRHPGDVRLGRDQVEEGAHGVDAVEQPLVHVDVEHLGAGFDLVPRNGKRRRIVAVGDQLAEAGGPSDVGAFTDIDEKRGHRAASGARASSPPL